VTLSLPKNSLKAGSTYVFTATVDEVGNEGNRNSSAEIEIETQWSDLVCNLTANATEIASLDGVYLSAEGYDPDLG